MKLFTNFRKIIYTDILRYYNLMYLTTKNSKIDKIKAYLIILVIKYVILAVIKYALDKTLSSNIREKYPEMIKCTEIV